VTPFVPKLLGFHERYGILIEEWLHVKTSHAADDFTHARDAGAALAELHGLAVPDEIGELAAGSEADLQPLFSVDDDLAARFTGLHDPRPYGKTWIHGDFHADQLAVVERDGERRLALLDLDRLSAGDPARDLANWIADHLFEDEDLGFEAAAQELLEGYGATLDADHLRRRTADELTRRGAAAIRRLEKGALERAARCLGRARAII
jgi:aminoglycoside phosphotransferase (APT) family kinase protein